ncbi:MAG TPA: transporter substrate-binding domain-containing protein, partial [Ktedonobacteraceae bacterium]|nr:transporter substrate-binding domain-containing protein [Ktedonobacteraceae bacterium]
MASFSSRKRGRLGSMRIVFVGIVVALTLLLAACGNSGTSTGSSNVPTPNTKTPTVTPPNDLLTPGTLTVGSDTTYPPQEYIDTTTHQAAGFDIDLITAVAQRMGLQAKIVTTSFDTIINSLTS